MKNRILSKNKGCLFFLLPKIYQLPEYYVMFAQKSFSPEFFGGLPPPLCPIPSPMPMYPCEESFEKRLRPVAALDSGLVDRWFQLTELGAARSK